MSTDHEAAPAPAAASSASNTESAPKETTRAELRPRPDLRRITHGQVMWLLLLGLLGLLYLTFHYAHRSLSPEGEPTAATAASQPPLDPGLIKRLGIDGQAPLLVTKPPPAPLPPPASWGPPPPPLPARQGGQHRERVLSAPLAQAGRRAQAHSAPAAAGEPADVLAALDRRLAAGADTTAPAQTHPESGGGARPGRSPVAHARIQPANRFDLAMGTAIPAVLLHQLNSDVAGLVRAQIARDVYDSRTTSVVLIPQGTLALGEQSGQPSAGDARLLIRWRRLRFPDGRTLELDDQESAAADGSLGLAGHVDRHWGRRFGSAILLSLVGAGVQLSQPQRSAVGGAAPAEGQIAAGELGRELGQLSAEILRQSVNLPPTVELRPGARLLILLTQDLVFDGPGLSN